MAERTRMFQIPSFGGWIVVRLGKTALFDAQTGWSNILLSTPPLEEGASHNGKPATAWGRRRCEINLNRAANSPLLASPQGGVAASIKKFRVATETDADGVVFLSLTFLSENHPGCALSGSFEISFCCAH